MKFATKAIHAGQSPDPATGAIMPPVYLTSTYVQEAPGQHKGFDYSRSSHPTRLALEKNLAALEGGAHGLAFASGMAAISTVILALQPGDHVVSSRDLYGGSYRVFTKVFARFGIRFSFVDTTHVPTLAEALEKSTRLIWLETPSNPLLQITDIRRISALARKKGIKVAVDNTFATPALQRPLELGAHIVVHSTTKYLGGHSDVVGGAIIGNDPEDFAAFKFLQNAVGAVPGPLDCFLVLRGTKTLPLRMTAHCHNARRLAEFLARHPQVRRVYYPGLRAHPGHALAKRQMAGFGGMIAFELSGSLKRALRLMAAVKLFSLAESLGGVESLISHPATMTHASIPKEEREKVGVTDSLLRLSVGVEHPDDLIDDLDQAIRKSG